MQPAPVTLAGPEVLSVPLADAAALASQLALWRPGPPSAALAPALAPEALSGQATEPGGDGARPSAAAAQPAAGCLVSERPELSERDALDVLADTLEAGKSADPRAAWLSELDAAWAPRAARRARELRRRSRVLARAAAAPDWSYFLADGSPRVNPLQRAQRFEDLDPGERATSTGGWHARRARGLGRALRSRLAACGAAAAAAWHPPLVWTAQEMRVRCACGPRGVVVACKQRWLCESCQVRTYARIRTKLTKALAAKTRAASRAWHAAGRPRGLLRSPVLVTMTVRHTGDLVADRAAITDGWKKLRQWLHGHRPLDPRGARLPRVGKFEYALVWETTSGRDGLGHVHAHAVALWPFVDWSLVRAEWLLATGGASETIDLVATSKRAARGESLAQGAANYLAKYTSKGVQVGEFSPELAASVLDSLWQKRICSTSARFWLPPPPCICPKCSTPWAVVEKPASRWNPEGPVWGPGFGWRLVGERGDVRAFGLAPTTS